MNIPWPDLAVPSASFSFEWPIMLVGLVLTPLLLLIYLLAQRRRRAYTLRFTNLALLGQVAGRAPAWRRHVPPVLYLLGLAALLVSLARPSAVVALPRDQASVVLVVDVSGSMNADDLKPYRMEAAKLAARSFIDRLPAQARAGLVRFSTTSSVVAPLTRDHHLVARSIDLLSANGGTAIGDGLNTALDLLAQRPTGLNDQRAPGAIVLLSDGASTFGVPPAEAATRAKEEGIKVYTVGVGQRGATPLIGGRQPARLDEPTLQQIASVSGGEYFYAAETSDLTRIYANLGSRIDVVEERTEITVLLAGLAALFMVVGGLLGLRWFQQLP